ncbi:MAG: DUF1269 domain-containing protein [Pseudomonadota bacterium]|nr:DUF1269 domain-containing protein [Pseudomonadota bacterium]
MAGKIDTLYVSAASYDDVKTAVGEYDTINALYNQLGTSYEFDAAVIEKTPSGHVRIVRTREQPSRHGAAMGLSWGLAAGVIAALFPAVGIWAGLAAGGGAGALIGALAGHVVGGMNRGDLKTLGDLLDRGQAGLVVVYAANRADQVANLLKAANVLKFELRDAAIDDLARAVNEAKNYTPPRPAVPA